MAISGIESLYLTRAERTPSSKARTMEFDPKRIPEQFVQDELCQSQLPGFIKRLHDAGATVQAVFRPLDNYGIALGRLSVVYCHFEELGCEILT